MAKIAYPECGKIVTTHGCHGGVKIESWCDTPEVLAGLPALYLKNNGAYRRVSLQKTAVSRNMVYATLEGVDTMEAADLLRGTVVYARREDLRLPEGCMLIAEMIGLPVFDVNTGDKLGVLKDVIHPAHTDIYVITTPKGEAMVPVVEEFVKRVSEEGIYLSPIEGMFEQ
ncbi:MAG: 16S rRNA processing protein RimM [Ruminococcaceae bacterium]|nr:16S rRNA processing protein RimM [Oscillospiraceae bacterium]